MNKTEFYKKIRGFSEENFIFDEPHFSRRCEEYGLDKKEIIDAVLTNRYDLNYILKDRKNVYKIYYRLSKRRLLKIIIDFEIYNKIRLRTIKIINEKKSEQLARISRQMKRRRF